MAESETNIQRRVQLALSDAGCTVWRNETANAWVGRYVGRTREGHVILADARQLAFGLCSGSADLIGVVPPHGRFLSAEVKTPRGRLTTEQRTFRDAVLAAGGIAGVVRSHEDAIALITQDDEAPNE